MVNCNANATNFIAKPTNSTAKPTNSIVKPTNSIANGTNSIAIPMNSTAKVTNSIAKTCINFNKRQNRHKTLTSALNRYLQISSDLSIRRNKRSYNLDSASHNQILLGIFIKIMQWLNYNWVTGYPLRSISCNRLG